MTLRPWAKVGLVVAGYAAAAAVAGAAVALHVATTAGPDRQAAGGMYAFGDALLWLGVFAVAAVPPTAGALFFLRPHGRFWRALSVAAALVAATELPTVVLYHVARASAGPAVLRILVAPPLAALFLLCAVFAPARSPRKVLLACTAVEAVAFASVALSWLRPR